MLKTTSNAGLLVLLVLAFSSLTACSDADSNDRRPAYAGAYVGDRIRVEIKSDDAGNYSGTIHLGDKHFPLTARTGANGLAGTFQSGGDKFDFSAAMEGGDGLLFKTGQTEYHLKIEKPAVANPLANPPANPLANPQPKNPLANGGGNVPPSPVAPARLKDATIAPGTGAGAKDPLAYRLLEFSGGSIAKFDNWQYSPIMGGGGLVYCDAFPEGRQKDFVMRAAIGTPNSQDLANLFVAGPQLVQQSLAQLFGPVFQPAGQPQKCTCGGDEAMVENYEGTINGAKYNCRVMYVKRKDVAIAVMGIGSDAGFKEFGRALEIVSQSITLKESAIEPGLIGTWVCENFSSAGEGKDKINVAQSRSIAIYPNGTFSDSAQTGTAGQDMTGLVNGGSRGSVVKRGNVLTFHYDSGTTWSPPYELYSNGLKLDGKVYLKQ